MKKLKQFGAIALMVLCAQVPVLQAQTTTNAAPSSTVAPPTATASTSTPPKPTAKPAPKPAASSTTAPATADQATMAPIVVTAAAATKDQAAITQQQAIDSQHNSVNLVNVISVDRIQDTTAKTFGEAAQKLPGVSVYNQRGEPQYIQIRGAAPDLNSIEFNGVELTTTSNQQGGTASGGGSGGASSSGRAPQVLLIPAGLGSLVLTKETTPDQATEGIGGTINIVPISAFDYAGTQHAEFNLAGGSDPIHGFDTKQGAGVSALGSGQYSRIFKLSDDTKLGIIVYGGINDTNRTYDDSEPSYSWPTGAVNGVSERDYLSSLRTRGSAGTNIDLKIADTAHYYINFFYTGQDEYRNGDRLEFNGLAGSPAKGNVDEYNESYHERSGLLNAIIGGENKLNDDLSVDYKAYFNRSTDQYFYDYKTTYNYNGTGTIGYSTYPHVTGSVTGGNIYDPSQYTLAKSTNTPFFFEDKIFGTMQDVKYKLPINDYQGEFKAGTDEQFRHADYAQNTASIKNTGEPLTANDLGAQTFYNGTYNLGNGVDAGTLFNTLANAGGGYSSTTANNVTNLEAQYGANETILSGYGQYSIDVEKLNILAGGRVEGTLDQFDYYNGTQPKGAPVASVTPGQTAKEYVNFLPSLQFKYDIDPKWTTRLGYSKSIARPTFEQIVPSQQYAESNTTTATLTTGNASLSPTRSHNIDWDVEYYPMDGAIATYGLFDKEISDYTYRSAATSLGAGVDPFNPAVNNYTVTTADQINHARIYGMEAQYEQQFKFLPDFWSGFGFYGSATWDKSRGQYHPGQPAQSLPGQAPLIGNFGVFYRKGKWNFLTGATYQSHYVTIVSSTVGTPDTFKDTSLELSAKVQYKIDDNFTIYAEGMNLNDNHLLYYQGDKNHVIQDEYYRPSFDSGLKITF